MSLELLCNMCFGPLRPREEKTKVLLVPAQCAACGVPIAPWRDEYHWVAKSNPEDLAVGAAAFEDSLKSEAGLKETLESCIHIMQTATDAELPVLKSSGVIEDFQRVVDAAKLHDKLIERALDLDMLINPVFVVEIPKTN